VCLGFMGRVSFLLQLKRAFFLFCFGIFFLQRKQRNNPKRQKKNVQIGAVNCDDEANKALCSKEGVGKNKKIKKQKSYSNF